MSTQPTATSPDTAAVVAAASIPDRQPDRFEIVPIDRIQKSDTNPRRRFDETKDKELAASIKQVGVLEPLLVRPYKAHVINLSGTYDYDLIAGERRLRGAKAAGLTEVPVIIKDLSEKEVLCIQIIENHQRQDIHPLDEGDGFERLIRQFQYTPKQIAEEIGSDESYVYKRVKIAASLIDEAREHFYAGRLTLGHYLQLSRLDEKSQKEALKEAWRPDWSQARIDDERPPNLEQPLSAKEFAEVIKKRFHLSLKGVPWDKTDEKLLKKAGACNTCPKRTGANALLFDDEGGEDNCLDAICFEKKAELHLVQVEKTSIKEGVKLVRVATSYADDKEIERLNCLPSHGAFQKVAKSDECDHTQPAVVVHGDNLGKRFNVCTSKKCKKHMAKPYTSPHAAKLTPDQKKAADAKQLARDVREETQKRIVEVILHNKLSTELGPNELQLIAADMTDGAAISDVTDLLGWKLKIKGQTNRWKQEKEAFIAEFRKATAPQQTKALMAFVLLRIIENGYGDGVDEEFLKVVKLYGLDWKHFEAKVREELAPADKEEPKVPAPTKKAKAAKTTKTAKAKTKKTAQPKARGAAAAAMEAYADDVDQEADYDEGEESESEDFGGEGAEE